MFAIDGVKLPFNASKAKSGTRADYQRQVTKMEAAAQNMLERHRQADSALTDAVAVRPHNLRGSNKKPNNSARG